MSTNPSLPKGDEYVAAVQHPAIAFRDNDLARGTFETSPNGLPRPYSGGFTRTFHALGTTGEWAVRCFTREVRDLARRYDAIGRFSGSMVDPAFVRAELMPAEILAAGRRHPVIKMDWIRAPQLNVYVDRNHRDSAAMHALAEGMLNLGQRLEALGIAHGDLQHGNILVTSLGSLRLVDYDDLYLPELAGLQFSSGLGHQNYQHQGRTSRDFGPHMDRFSLFAIYLALLALAEDSTLWHEYDGGDERMLFKREDFAEPETSPLFADLAKRESLAEWVDRFAAVCHGSYAEIPSPADFVAGRFDYARFVPGGPRPAGKPMVAAALAEPAPEASLPEERPPDEPLAFEPTFSFEPSRPSLRDRISALVARLTHRSVVVPVATVAAIVLSLALAFVFRDAIVNFVLPPPPANDPSMQGDAPPPPPAHHEHRIARGIPHHGSEPHHAAHPATEPAAAAPPAYAGPVHASVGSSHSISAHPHHRIAAATHKRVHHAIPPGATTASVPNHPPERRTTDATTALLDAAAGSASSASKCGAADSPARILTESVPAVSKFGTAAAAGNSADVAVSLTPAGSIASAYIATSSGSADMDAAALDAARRSTYSPEITNCVRVASSLTVHVRF